MIKLKAYTIMELIVVMVLSAIVISIAYTSFNIVSNQYRNYKKTNEVINTILLLDHLLTKDFGNCDYIKTSQEGIDCVYRNKIVSYDITQSFILRREYQLIDTFQVMPKDIEFKYLESQIINTGSFIKSLSFIQSYRDEEQSFSYTKKYSSEFLMLAEELYKSR